MTLTASNPVEEQVLHLVDEYLVFQSDKQAQVLVWNTDLDTKQMLQVMLTFSSEQSALTPDFMFGAGVPFKTAENFETELVDWFIADLEASQDMLEPPMKGWDARADVNEDAPLLSLLSSLADKVAEHAEHVSIFVRYDGVDDVPAFATWLSGLTRDGVPENVQLIAFDDDHGSIAEALQELPEGMLMVRNPVVDMNEVMEDTFSASQKDAADGPEKDFETELVFAVTALRKQDYDAAFKKAEKAFQIAQSQRWWTHQMNALLIFGNAVLGKGDYAMVRKCSDQAVAVREEAGDDGDQQMLDMLLMQALFLRGNGELMQSRFEEGALYYTKASEAAQKVANVLLQFEANRMATHCWLKNGTPESSFETGMGALDQAVQFPEDLQKDGTLQYLLGDLKKASKRVSRGKAQLEERMSELFGEDWEEALSVA